MGCLPSALQLGPGAEAWGAPPCLVSPSSWSLLFRSSFLLLKDRRDHIWPGPSWWVAGLQAKWSGSKMKRGETKFGWGTDRISAAVAVSPCSSSLPDLLPSADASGSPVCFRIPLAALVYPAPLNHPPDPFAPSASHHAAGSCPWAAGCPSILFSLNFTANISAGLLGN